MEDLRGEKCWLRGRWIGGADGGSEWEEGGKTEAAVFCVKGCLSREEWWGVDVEENPKPWRSAAVDHACLSLDGFTQPRTGATCSPTNGRHRLGGQFCLAGRDNAELCAGL